MADPKPYDPGSEVCPLIEEIPERLDEQHHFTTLTLGFLLHPTIPAPSPTAKIADIGTGTGIFLLSLAATLPSSVQLTGFDVTPSGFPATHPANVSFRMQDMFQPFPAEELGTYDVVTVRFVSSATTRAEWARGVENLTTLLRPGGWLQWIESCNFALYNEVAGTSRAACREVWAGLKPFREKEDLVVGLMMREGNAEGVGREEIWRGCGLEEVREDVFSSDRLRDEASRGLRETGTRNVMECFLGCLEELVGVEGSGWTKERIERLRGEVGREIDAGVYHTLDQVCMVGRKPERS